MMARVEALLFEARNLDQSLSSLTSGQGGHIRRGMTAVCSTSMGDPIIAEWYNAHPQAKRDPCCTGNGEPAGRGCPE